MGAVSVTGSHQLAKILRADFIDNELKTAFRRAGWMLAKGWLRKEIINDPFFNFTEGLSADQLKSVETFLEKHKHKYPQTIFISDQLFITAAVIHLMIEKGASQQLTEKITAFYRLADQLLEDLAQKQSEIPVPDKKLKQRPDDFCEHKATQALQDFAKLLPNNQFTWYVVSGTLLGLHREGAFLKHDYDIDLGINYTPELYQAITKLIDTSHFVVSKLDHYSEVIKNDQGQYQLKKRPAIIKLIHPNGISIDLFIHHQDGDLLWHGSSIHRWENKHYELELRDLAGIKVLAPQNADQYLTENYGDWRTPVKAFDCSTGTPNLVIAKNFLSLALFLKRLAVFSDTNPLEYEKLRKTLNQQAIIKNNTLNKEMF